MESLPSLFAVPAAREAAERAPRNRESLVAAEAEAAPIANSVATRACRLGLLVDGLVQERWVIDAVQATLSVPGVYLATIAVAARGRSNSVARRLHRMLASVDGLRCRHEHLLSAADMVTWFRGVPRVEIAVEETPDGWTPDAAGVETLRNVSG